MAAKKVWGFYFWKTDIFVESSIGKNTYIPPADARKKFSLCIILKEILEYCATNISRYDYLAYVGQF